MYPKELLSQKLGGDGGVTAVVAGTGENQHVLPIAESRREGGRGRSGTLHEWHVAGRLLDAPDVVREVDRALHVPTLLLGDADQPVGQPSGELGKDGDERDAQ